MAADIHNQSDRLEKLSKILKVLDGAAAGGGFSDDTVVKIVLLWTEFSAMHIGESYWKRSKTLWPVFARKYPQESGKKTSAVLHAKVKFLYYTISKDTDTNRIAKAYSEAQGKLQEFVWEYRAALRGGSDQAMTKFDKLLASTIDVNDPDFGSTRGH